MLSGDNGILQKATDAKTGTTVGQEKETIALAYNSALAKKVSNGNSSAVIYSELNDELDSSEATASGNPIIVTFSKTGHTYTIDEYGNIQKDETIVVDRTGINVGDYIYYTPSSSNTVTSVSFNKDETGYSTYATTPGMITRKNLFRVLNIDSNGNIELIGVVTSSDPKIYFYGAQGYNNAVYVLNKKCSDLYKDEEKGIIARSIKVEDITDRMIEGTEGEYSFSSSGRKKIVAWQKSNFSMTGVGENVVKDATNYTITYANGNTDCPDIFQYEEGGKIEDIATSGIIGQSETYSGYNGVTSLENLTPKPSSLTVRDTTCCITLAESDFDDSDGNAVAFGDIFLKSSPRYWLASRAVHVGTYAPGFRVRKISTNSTGPDSYQTFLETGYDEDCNPVCPIVFIPSNINVTISTDSSNFHQSQPHTVITQ